jgi:hypothetical protein
MAASRAAKEALWLRKLLRDFYYDINCVPMFVDNPGAIKVIKHPIASSRTKNIDVMHHFVRERVARSRDPSFVPQAACAVPLLRQPHGVFSDTNRNVLG